MSPSEGVVEVGESKAVICSIRPSAASVFVSQAVLKVGQGVNAIKPKPVLDMKARIAHRHWHTFCRWWDAWDIVTMLFKSWITTRDNEVICTVYTGIYKQWMRLPAIMATDVIACHRIKLFPT